MSQRGVKAYRQWLWESQQRRDGREDARAGRSADMADQFYQRGYREGLARCRCSNSTVHEDGCVKVPNGTLCAWCRAGHNP